MHPASLQRVVVEQAAAGEARVAWMVLGAAMKGLEKGTVEVAQLAAKVGVEVGTVEVA